MDLNNPELLSNILTSDELEKIGVPIQQKLKKYFEEFFDEYCKEKAAASRLEQCEQQSQDLKSEIEDYQLKIGNFEKNVHELRKQLDALSSERTSLLETISRYEVEAVGMRQEKNKCVEERDSFLKVIDRQNLEIERLKEDLKIYQQQLKTAINAKCEAITKIDEIESREISLEFKERRMEQDRALLENQIQTLTTDLNRTTLELQSVRRDHKLQSMHIETQLTEKIEEIKIIENQNIQNKATIERLTQNVQELTTKLLNQNEEANKMMDYFKRELEAKTKLAELYKGNCDDNEMERNELELAIADMKRMLMEASDQYGELETKLKAIELQHGQEMDEKENTIEALKTEIAHANDLLKEIKQETVENALSKIAPSAAVASRLIRCDMSLTELYSLYAKATEDLEVQKRENGRLNLQMKSILQELSENAPVLKKQEIEFEKIIENNKILTEQRDELLSKKCELDENLESARTKLLYVERENKKLKQSQIDLSRQVCFLLKEVEQLRIGQNGEHVPREEDTVMLSAEECISKKFVTFKNIVELQEKNNKLITLVRDLSGKIEEAELAKTDFSEAICNERLEAYVRKLESMQDILNKQNATVSTLVAKCDRYKKLYFELQKSNNKDSLNNDLSDVEDMEMGERDKENSNDISIEQQKAMEKKEKNEILLGNRISDLEQQLAESKEQYKSLKEQYEFYSKEKKNNEKLLNEQFDAIRTELREMTSNNCKLMSTAEYNKEQIKLQQKNIATYKQQISTLEDRNKNYENTIFKHEQTVNYLRDEILKSQRSQAAAEAEVSHLRHENRILKDTASRLQSEKESFNREQKNQALLLNNLEIIKSNLERSEMEGKARLEQRLDETVRELAAQRRRFQEEEDRFRESMADMQRQTKSAQKIMEEEKVVAEKLRIEINKLRDELKSKTEQIEELSKKLQEVLTPSQNENPITVANKKVRELEVKLSEAKLEINSLNNDLTKSREHADQYYKMSQSAEAEIKNLHMGHSEFIKKSEAEINNLKQIEADLRSRIEELQSENQLAIVSESVHANNSDQLKEAQNELKDTLLKLGECHRNLRALRDENKQLSEQLSLVESKYSNEMILHSADIQELSKLKQEASKVHSKIMGLTEERDKAQAAYEELKKSHNDSIQMLEKEKIELESRIEGINKLNSSLHEQIEALANKLSVLSGQSANTSISGNDSMMDTSLSSSDLHRSQAEEENKNNEQLLQIIKFLRKEKDLNIAKLDILKAENTRLVSELTILQKRVDELNGFLSQERAKSETNITSASKHEEILRKIETLNAITDSNRILRDERNALSTRVKELNERISKLEDELFPLQSQTRDLTLKIDELSSENTSLRTEAMKWRQRANLLIEKSNKNPEEYKRLQAEKDHLIKLLSAEKETMKKTLEELSVVKSRLESEIPALEKQVQTLNEEKKKLTEEIASVKQNNNRMLQEIMELKNKLLQKEDEIQKFTADIAAKDHLYQDLKSKEMQIRKIAKRYKDSYIEILNKSPKTAASAELAKESVTDPTVGQENVGNGAGILEGSGQANQSSSNMDSLNNMIKNMQEENDKLKKEYEELKAAIEVDEQTKTLLKDARAKIVSLTESKNVISQELASTKKSFQSYMQSSESQMSIINGIKSEYQETINRLEKELLDQTAQNKEAINRITRENESLLMRIGQLGRQLGIQQSSKPTTSTVAIMEKGNMTDSSPRTANVKPMSGSATVQQSATVTPWRGGETPLASIRPISVQNSRTAAILPTSQQTTGGTSSSSTSTSSSAPSVGNTALVPPQQQVHTTGSSSLESMSSSPTSSHTDYMPSTSSASVAVAAIPPMGSSGPVAESSHEAESVQQQQSESQVVIGSVQQQVVALVSPRVEGSLNVESTPQNLLDGANPQPSTSGTSSTTHVIVSSHSRHTPSSSSVTTSQAGSSIGHKRPRDQDDDFSTSNDECSADKASKTMKRTRNTVHADEGDANMGDMGIDVDQVPTSSQRDQEDDIVIVDSDEDAVNEVDDGPAEAEVEQGYEHSYEPEPNIGENDGPETNDIADCRVEASENNEVDVDIGCSENQFQCIADNQVEETSYDTSDSTSKAATSDTDNNQQSQTITSGSSEESLGNVAASTALWKHATSSTHSLRTQEGSSELVSSPQDSNMENSPEVEAKSTSDETSSKSSDTVEIVEKAIDQESSDSAKEVVAENNELNPNETDDLEEYSEDQAISGENEEMPDADGQLRIGASQSDIQDIQQSQMEEDQSEDAELVDGGVSSEGEKQAVEGMEEEGREAEASTSPSITTRSKAIRGAATPRRMGRGVPRGTNNRPTPIIWQESPGTSRNAGQSPTQLRGFPNQRSQRGRRMRRPTAPFSNIRFQ